MAAVPSPVARTGTLPGRVPSIEAPQGRPDLSVVAPVRHTGRFVVLVGLVTLLGIFGVVSLHALAAEASFAARALETEVSDLALRYDELEAEVAQLSSPDRIREVATTQLGMVPAEQPYVVLGADELEDAPADARLALERLRVNR